MRQIRPLSPTRTELPTTLSGAGATELDVDDAVEDEVDCKVDEQEKVSDDDRRLIGVVDGRLSAFFQYERAEQREDLGRPDEHGEQHD